MDYSIYALHGFLGKASDWDFLHLPLKDHDVHAVDLVTLPSESIEQWAKRFNDQISIDKQNILLGYSMGGRLAMHALLQAPEKWKGAIIISSHPGLRDKKLQEDRLTTDREWANSFSNDPWDILMEKWNGRPALKSSLPIPRKEKEYLREQLSMQLENWSLGRQNNLHQALTEIDRPVLWLAGEKDTTYASLANEITFSHKNSKKTIVPNCGHRLPWDAKNTFIANVTSFIKGL